ncbi:UNVERIFIED_ORG: DNA-binding GntR family transcriptional regulator [Gordonia westfalica J30]
MRLARRLRIKDDVLAILRESILAGEFAPGERLNETELAERLDVSRGPIRDAFASLAHEGLVISEPHRGTMVPLLSPADIAEIYSLRTALETLAARRAVTHATEDDLAALAAALDNIASVVDGGGDRRAVTDADLSFHDVLYAAAHHDRLTTAWRSLRSQVALCLFSRNTVAETSRAITVDEHAQLLSLLQDRDEESLVNAVTAHLEGAAHKLISAYTR